MPIKIEYFKTRNDGVALNRTYSDSGFMIEREGVRYSEAIDPVELKRQYTETDELVEKNRTGNPNEATATDYQAALSEFGVSV